MNVAARNRQIRTEPLEDDITETKLTLKTKHQKIMVNGVECRRQIKQAQSRDLATIGCQDLQHRSLSTD